MNLRKAVHDRICELKEDARITETDMHAKIKRKDLHGVRDAVVDIETFKAKIEAFQEVIAFLDLGTPL